MSKVKKLIQIVTLGCVLTLLLATKSQVALAQKVEKKEQSPVFSTWAGFEPDKCASIWLIQRFIHPEAVIKFFPVGEL
ncbi:MAG: chromate resistance protein ChrB domain-containing protein [bacterium]